MPPTATPPKKEEKTSTLLVHYYGVLFLTIVGLFLLAGWILLRPQLQTYKIALAEIHAKEARLQGEQGYLGSLRRSIAAAQKIPEATLEDVNEALPSEPGIPELIVRLARIAREYKVTLSNIQFTEPVPVAGGEGGDVASQGAPVQALTINMNLASPSYSATRRYLDAVERNLRLFDVQTLSVSPGQGEDGQAYSVELRTYMLPPTTRP